MKKSKFLFIALIVMLSCSSFSNLIAAEQDDIVNKTEQVSDPQKDQIIQLINEYLNEIEVKLGTIDAKIDKIRLQEEFAYYPAIRLNVDSPILGMNTVIENRLRVKKDISTSDVAAKYSIRDIVKNKTIRLPESYLGAIVVATKEVKIDSTMELPEAKLTLVKCIQYLSQVNSTVEFVDSQTNKIFKDYVSDTKKNGIKDIKDRNSRIESELETIADQIKIQALLGVDVKTYAEKYSTISAGLYEVSEGAKNQLILESDLNNLMIKSASLEAEVLTLKDTVAKAYDQSIQNMDYGVYLNNVYNDFENRKDTIKEYIENSIQEEPVEKDKDVDVKEPENPEEPKEDKEEKEVKTIVKYEVTSNATLDYMELTIDEVETLVKDYNDSQKQDENPTEEPEEVVELTKEEKDEKLQEDKDKVEALFAKYKDFLSREYKFYTNNINMLLDDSNDKISAIIAELDSDIEISDDIFAYTKYIYIDLPSNLTKNLNRNNLDSVIELNSLITALKNEIVTLSFNDMRITTMYNNMISDILES